MSTYTYLNTDFKNAPVVDISEVQSLVAASSITTATLLYINTVNLIYYFNFSEALSPADKLILDGIVANYVKQTIQEDAISNTSVSTLFNKNLINSNNFFVDATVNTKRIGFVSSSATANTTLSLNSITTSNRTITFPDINDTLITNTSSATLTNKIITNARFNGTGSTLITGGTLNSTPSSTSLTGANNYFFNVFRTPTTTGTTTGNIYNVYLEGISSGSTNNFSLYIDTGKTYIGGILQYNQSPASGHILVSDSSGNASWQSPNILSFSFGNGTVTSPSIFFTNFPTTGFYIPTSGQVSLTIGGTRYYNFTTTSFTTNVQNIITNTTNQIVLGTTNTVTLNSSPPSASRIYTIPDVGANSNFIMSSSISGQTISGTLALTNDVVSTQSFTAAGQLYLLSTLGIINLSNTQFSTNGSIVVTKTNNQFIVGATNTTTITMADPAANRIYTVPDVGNNANFVMTDGTQAIAGLKTFTNNGLATSSTIGGLGVTGGITASRNIWLGSTSNVSVTASNGVIFNIPNITLTNITTPANTITSFMNLVSFRQPTFASSNTGVNVQDGSTLYIEGAPIKGTNQTFTDLYGLFIDNINALSTSVAEAASLYIKGSPSIISGNTYSMKIDSGITYLGGPIQIPSGAVDKFVFRSDSNGNATWSLPFIPYKNVLLNTTINSTATTLTNITGVQITIDIDGTYLLYFNTTFSSSSTNRNVTFDVTRNNVVITNLTSTYVVSTALQRNTGLLTGIVTTGLGDVFRVRASITANTLIIGPYISFIMVRIDD